MSRRVPGIAAEQFVGPLSGKENLDSVGPAGSCDGEQGRLAGMVGGAVEIPDADRPEPKVLLARYRHLVDRDLDMATDPQCLGRLAAADGCIGDVADHARPVVAGIRRDKA